MARKTRKVRSTTANARRDLFGKPYWDHQNTPILQIGPVSYSRDGLARQLGVTHTVAAARLNKILRHMKVTSVYEMYRIPLVNWASVVGVGESMLRVMLAVLDHQGYSNDQILRWIEHKSVTRGSRYESIRLAVKKGRKRRHTV